MDTRGELRLWEQASWPADDFTVDDNRADVLDLATRHDGGRAFAHTVVDPLDTEAWGCVYVFPPTATHLTKATVSPLSDVSWQDVDAVAYFWVRSSRSTHGLDKALLEALGRGSRPNSRHTAFAQETVRVRSSGGQIALPTHRFDDGAHRVRDSREASAARSQPSETPLAHRAFPHARSVSPRHVPEREQ